MEWVSIDATHIRAHQSSAGAAGGDCQHIAKSVGGNSSKIHVAVDAHELLSNLVYGIQAAFSVDCSSSCLPSLKMTLLTTKVNKLNP